VRSLREIAYRLWQDGANLAHLALRRRAVPVQASPLAALPAPADVAAALRGSAHARKIERIAQLALDHRFPILGFTVTTGREPDWSRDYVHGKAAPRRYFRRIPYLDFDAAGDHKIVWELNRHQHWVVLAQAYRLTGEEKFLEEIWVEFRSWRAANPFLRSVNWTSALEVAFRALSWTWVYHLAAGRMPPRLRRHFLVELYWHGLCLESNLSVYFSPNTHLLGEAVALETLGALFPAFPRAAKWRRTGARIVEEQAERQVREDGSHFEQSAYYHVYALDLLLWHAVVAGMTPALRTRIARMAEYLDALMGPARRLPLLGDDDGGRMFHPYGPREFFGRATLATAGALLGEDFGSSADDAAVQAAWWLGPRAPHPGTAGRRKRESKLFRGAGVAAMIDGGVQVLVDVGPFGPGSAGHSHSDTLSLVVRDGDEDTLIDPGTFTYVSDPRWRDWFRGSAAHNTTRVNESDEAQTAGPFRWRGRPEVELKRWTGRYLEAVCAHGGVHRRRQVLFADQRLLVLDTVEGEGELLVEQFWHAGPEVRQVGPGCFRIGRRARLTLAAGGAQIACAEDGWRSCVFGRKTKAWVVCARVKAHAPVRLAVALDFRGSEPPAGLTVEEVDALLAEAGA
jgi:hypothetical protein